jgi:hypothetical protein
MNPKSISHDKKSNGIEIKVERAIEELQVIGERLEEFQAIVHEHNIDNQ